MQGRVLRALGVFALSAAIAGCHPSVRSTAGQTPEPSNTTMAQANSTAAPDRGLTMSPGEKYAVKTSSDLHSVTFSVWANGRPITSVQTPNAAIDITKDMRGHANTIVVEWSRTQKNGAGTLTLVTGKKTLLTQKVTPSSPATGKRSIPLIASQAVKGR